MDGFFQLSEFACKCGCGEVAVHPELLDRLSRLRVLLGTPVVITSGYRCPKHNEAVGGKPDSAHMKGMAADIKAEGTFDRTHKLWLAGRAGFPRVGVAENFIHVDVDTSLPLGVWLYGRGGL